MCIIIDTNTLEKVFKSTLTEFKPVLDWIKDSKSNGKIVYGGKKYLEEITKAGYLKTFVEYGKVRKTIRIDDDEVDLKTTFVCSKHKQHNFNDQHIVALLLVSGCKLICSCDKKAHPFFKHKKFFSPQDKPKIYSNKLHAKLLCDANVPAKYKKN